MLWTTRDGAEHDLWEELTLTAPAARPRVVGPALVVSRALAAFPTFARQSLPVFATLGADADEIAGALLATLLPQHAWALHVWCPDTDLGNRRAARADALAAAVSARLEARAPDVAASRIDVSALRNAPDAVVAQLALIDESRVVVGASPSGELPSLWPGGRARMRVGHDRPSRAARKLEEAFAVLGLQPEPGELCVDLGAAPGGWSWLLLEKRARVIAVDPASLRPDLLARRALRHVRASAFGFEPEESVDWLLCDMAWRPLEVAALLAKWARRGWARVLVCNLKLPMKRKAELVLRARDVLAEGGWAHLRLRQLYHDRDEITAVAVRA